MGHWAWGIGHWKEAGQYWVKNRAYAKLHAVGAIYELPLPENHSFWLLFA